jgi:predicted DNA-binding helix-hairpin-helix protein
MGICHSYTPDGRCVSLLKILLTNACIFDCSYCINRRSSGVRRARFTPEEVVRLTLDFYRRNYIEGLFLSSGIVKSSDHTMEQLVRVARTLREEHGFAGYIHLKTIPDASPALIEEAGRWADRLSINVELADAGGADRSGAGEAAGADHRGDGPDPRGDRRCEGRTGGERRSRRASRRRGRARR